MPQEDSRRGGRLAWRPAAFVLGLGWWLAASVALAQEGRVFIDPPVIRPAANGLLRFSVRVEGVPAPGLGAYGLTLALAGQHVSLVDGQVVSATVPAGQVACSARLNEGAATVQDVGVLLLMSGQGDLLLNSRGPGEVSCAQNGLLNGVPAYACGVRAGPTGLPTPQVGSGALLDMLCFASPTVPQGTVITVTPGLFPPEEGAIFVFGTGTPVIATFTAGQIVIGSPPNRAPQVDAIAAQTVDEGQTLTLMATATDPDAGTVLTLEASNLPPFATFTDNGQGKGTFTFTPNFTQAGTYTGIAVTARDNGLPSLADTQTFTLTVRQVNRRPELATIGPQMVDEGQTLTVMVTATDPDAGDALTLSATGLPPFGTFTDNGQGQGTLTFRPNFTQAGTYANTQITATDNGIPPLSSSHTFSLTVKNINREPAWEAIAAPVVVQTGQTVTVPVMATDPDGDALTLALVGTSPGFVMFTQDGGGKGSVKLTPGPGDTGQVTVTLVATDTGTPPLSKQVAFTVRVDQAEAPRLAPIGDRMLDENTVLTIAVLATAPAGQPLTLTTAALPRFATLTDHGDGRGSFTLSPVTGDGGTYTLTVTATSQTTRLTASETFMVTVHANRPPVLEPIGSKSTPEGVLLTFALRASDPDEDTLTFTAGNLPPGAVLTDHGTGTATFRWTPGFDAAGNYRVLFSVVDDGAPMRDDREDVLITVGNVNRPPALAPVGPQTVREGEPLTLALRAEDPDRDRLAFTVAPVPPGAVLTDHGTGTATFRWTPGFTDAGTVTVLFTVTDNGTPPGQDDENVTITVGEVNRPPVLKPLGTRQVRVGERLELVLMATDPDGHLLSFQATPLPPGATLTDHGDGTAMLRWTPAAAALGSLDVRLRVTDSGTPPLSADEVVTVRVVEGNRPPELAPIGQQRVAEGQHRAVVVSATDPDGNDLTLTATGLPAFATFTDHGDGTGTLLLTPGPGTAGTYAVTLMAVDDATPALADGETFQILVSRQQPGDINGDGVVDQRDIAMILGALNTPASGPDDPRDLDHDGMITALDARQAVLVCTRPRCATP